MAVSWPITITTAQRTGISGWAFAGSPGAKMAGRSLRIPSRDDKSGPLVWWTQWTCTNFPINPYRWNSVILQRISNGKTKEIPGEACRG
jgi:hypothetical protein